jgi:alpha-tubulin suppressor-like RCC1 family protein
MKTTTELYQKLKPKLRVLDFAAGKDRMFILNEKMMTFSYGYKPNGYRCKNIGRSAKLLYWSPTCDYGHTPTYEEFCVLYGLQEVASEA